MNHKPGFNRLSRRQGQRKALLRSLLTSLFRHESIVTTQAKARELRRLAEKEISRARRDTVHNRRMAARKIYDPAVLARLFKEIAPRFIKRPGGYTRILRIDERKQDAAKMVIIELVDKIEDKRSEEREKRREEKRAKARAAAAASS